MVILFTLVAKEEHSARPYLSHEHYILLSKARHMAKSKVNGHKIILFSPGGRENSEDA